MEQSLWQQSSFLWGLGLIIIFPFLTVILSETIIFLQPRFSYLIDTLQIVRNLILPCFAVFILLNKVLEISANTTPIKIVETLVGVCTIHGLLTFLNGLLFDSAKVGTWQANTPKLFRDLIRFFLILIGTAIVLSVVWKTDLGGLITALGVSSIVLGLALQDTLGNSFSGIALLFGRPFTVGDWLEFNGTTGKVIEINWRSVHLLTRELELLVIPNAILAKEVIRNYYRPQKLHVELVEIRFSYNDPPNKVKQVLKEAALGTRGVLDKPEPVIQTIKYNDSAIDYRIRLFLADYDKVPQIRDEFMTRIWYAANRNNLNIPFPIRTIYHEPSSKNKHEERFSQFVEYLRIFPSFIYLEKSDLEKLAKNASLKHFGVGEIAIDRENMQRSMYLIIAGTAKISVLDNLGKEREIASISRGEFFGEMSLLSNNSRTISVTAIEDLEVLVLKTETVQDVLDRVPRLSREIGEIIETRRRAIRLAKKDSN
jgi:small-conductance mechanosensitive channel